jgi:glycosyltransferase involved in cell wall biosynthesis
MILFDTTNASRWRHGSGLSRVSARLAAELGGGASRVRWPAPAATAGPRDWFLTPELFSEAERPGFGAFVDAPPCGLAAVYHDAIPIKHPDITWPESVRRHPGYMKLLSRFDRVWAVSRASRDELLGFWRWQGVGAQPDVGVLELGADWPGVPRGAGGPPPGAGRPRIVSVGILEPRKNQDVLMDAFEELRAQGLDFELHLVGRVNPHFGGPIRERAGRIGAKDPALKYHGPLDDAELARLVRSARATAMASVAEGCGLPLLESLWMGVPCICSDIEALAESAAGGGCEVVPGNTAGAWVEALRRVVTDEAHASRLAGEAQSRALPTWAGAAAAIRSALSGAPR